ncbi:unnamed protein product [Prorocentrum cordatum]|uniref:Uncharacterized protein n=1 Tax=Prorocentrum cordatum TaxID=2364126 RepID=A0ABN9RU07_9DINO|nr:unnamed protein product [Polarella glacialis]
MHLTNALVSLFSFWERGPPKARASYPDLQWSPARRVAVGNLYQDLFEFCRAAGRDAQPTRGLARLQKLASELFALPGSSYDRRLRPEGDPGWGMHVGQLSADTLARALEVKPERVKLKTPGPGCDPADHLAGWRLEEYVGYLGRCLAPGDWPASLPRRCHSISKGNERILAQDLLDRGMAILAPASEVPRDKNGCVLASGWFAVEHSEQWGRLIQDRRPQNATEERMAWLQLPSGEQLKLLRLKGPTEHVRGTVYDLKTYFYQVNRPTGTEPRNVVGRPWQGRLLGSYATEPNTYYYLALTAWGMGDANSCDVCQETNVSILKKQGCMTPAESLNAQLTAPIGKTWEGNYLDDHLTVQVFSEGDDRSKLRDVEINERAKQAWESAGLPRSVEKDFVEQPTFTAWGTEVRDDPGEVGSPRLKRLDWNEIDQVPMPTRMCRPVNDLNEAFASFDWKVQRGGRFSKHSHINLQEMRALKGEIRRRGFDNIQMALRGDVLGSSGVTAASRARDLEAEFSHVAEGRSGSAHVSREVWIGAHFNPADAPSRFRPLLEAGPPPEWIVASQREAGAAARAAAARHPLPVPGSPGLGPAPAAAQAPAAAPPAAEEALSSSAPCCDWQPRGEPSRLQWSVPRGLARLWPKQEYFAGCGAVPRAWAARGARVEAAIDAFPPSGYRPAQDLLQAANVRRELERIRDRAVRAGARATSCTSLGLLCQNCGPGTRSAARPQGGGSRQAERDGHGLAVTTAAACQALGEEGGLWVVENPRRSWLFRQPRLQRLLGREGVFLVECDMCQFGLGPPDDAGARYKKSTYLLGNFEELKLLRRRCQGRRRHVHLEGGVKVGGRWQKRAALAAAYTGEFADALVAALGKAERRDLQTSLRGNAHAARLVKAAEMLSAFGKVQRWGKLEHWLPTATRSQILNRLIEFVQYLFNEKRSIAEARCAILVVQQRRPELRGQLGGAWDSVRSWAFGEDSQTRTPIPREIQRALRRWALARALLLTRRPCLTFLEYSIFVRVAMDGLLRPGEGAKLKDGRQRDRLHTTFKKPMLPQPYSISNLRLPTRWTASGRSSAAWMSALPATKPSAARLRLSASSLLEAASRVEVTAGKTAFGEQVGTVFDEKHDYELGTILPEVVCAGPLKDGDEAGGPKDALVAVSLQTPARSTSANKSCPPSRWALVLAWPASAGTWWSLLRLLWLDDFVQSIFDGRYFKSLGVPIVLVLCGLLAHRPDIVLDAVASCVLGRMEHLADRSFASVYRLSRRGASAVSSAATKTQDMAEMVVTVFENASVMWDNLSAVVPVVESAAALVDEMIENTAARTAELVDQVPEQMQAEAVHLAESIASTVRSDGGPPLLQQPKSRGWAKYVIAMFVGGWVQRYRRG